MKRIWIVVVILLVTATQAMAQDPGWIGVTVVDEADGGARIQSIQPESPAARAGLQTNDILTEFNGQTVIGVLQLTRLVRETPVGRTVDVRYRRGTDRKTVQITTDRTPGAISLFTRDGGIQIPALGDIRTHVNVTPGSFLITTTGSVGGVRVTSLSPQLRDFFGVTGNRGVLVESVDAGSAAANAGVQAGDVITAVSGMAVSTPAEFTMRMRAAGSNLNLEVVRDKKPRTLSLEGVTVR